MSDEFWQYGLDPDNLAKSAGVPFLKFWAQFDKSDETINVDEAWVRYLVDGAENKNDIYCQRLLVFVGTQWLANYGVLGDAKGPTKNAVLEDAALPYLARLLLRIVDFQEPNKVFGWTKKGKGRKQNPDFFEIFCVALPELRRKHRLQRLRASLKDPEIPRRTLQKLSAEETKLAEPPLYLKPGKNERDGSNEYYKQRAIETILAKHKETAQYFFDKEQQAQGAVGLRADAQLSTD